MTPAEARRVLGLRPDDRDPDRLRRAYRHTVRSHHPDRPGGDAVRFRQSVVAFELLAVTADQAIVPDGLTPSESPSRPDAAETDRPRWICSWRGSIGSAR